MRKRDDRSGKINKDYCEKKAVARGGLLLATVCFGTCLFWDLFFLGAGYFEIWFLMKKIVNVQKWVHNLKYLEDQKNQN